MTTDCNGKRVCRDVRREKATDGTLVWGSNVWWGGGPCVTNVTRYYYATRDAARSADISDDRSPRVFVAVRSYAL